MADSPVTLSDTKRPASELTAADKTELANAVRSEVLPFIDVTAAPHNAAGDGVTNDDAAFASAVAELNANGGRLHIPAGHYKLSQDIVLNKDGFTFSGDGKSTFLDFSGAGLVVDASANAANLTNWTLADFRTTRTGTAGPAIHLKGLCNEADAISLWRGNTRFHCSNIRVDDSSGYGWQIDYSYLGAFVNCFVLGATVGWHMIRSATNRAPANALQWLGGETQGCQQGFEVSGTKGISLVGHAIEGNSVSGFDDYGDNSGLTIRDGYFEQNGAATTGLDIRIGLASAYDPSHGVYISGNVFFAGSIGADHSISVDRARWFVERENTWIGYSEEAIDNTDSAGTAVFGISESSTKTNDSSRAVLNTTSISMVRNETWRGNDVDGEGSGAIGLGNFVTADEAFAIGSGHTVDKKWSMAVGHSGRPDVEGSHVVSPGRHAVDGDAQSAMIPFLKRTTDASTQNMLAGNGQMIPLPAATTLSYFIRGQIIGIDEATGDSAAYSIECSMDWDGTTRLFNKSGTTGATIAFDQNHDDIGVASVPELDGGSSLLRPKVEGKAATNIKWSATLLLTKVVA